MQRSTRIFYIGTYERDYPRNALTIAALRRAGYSVQELNQAAWAGVSDKTALLGSPRSMVKLGCRLLLAYLRLLAGLAKHLRDADLVVCGYPGQLDLLLFGPLLKALRIPVLFDPLITLTDTLVDDREKLSSSGFAANVIKWIDQRALRQAGTILADTPENREYLASTFGVPSERINVVPVGADERVFTPRAIAGAGAPGRDDQTDTGRPPSRSMSRNGRVNVLFYGTMIPLQGVETIVRAAKLLEDDHDIAFVIVGSGQTLPAVKRCAAQLGIHNVTFIARVPYEELPRRIDASEIVLGIFGSTAKAERVVPNKVYQAMAMGAAIITRDSPAMRLLLRDGESALLIPPDDPHTLAEAIQRLSDADLRSRLGGAARARFVEMASLEVQARAIREAVDMATTASTPDRDPVTV